MGKGTKIAIYVKGKWISYFVQRRRRRVSQPLLPFVRNGYFFRQLEFSHAPTHRPNGWERLKNDWRMTEGQLRNDWGNRSKRKVWTYGRRT